MGKVTPRWGATKIAPGRWRIATWAPSLDRLDLAIGKRSLPMSRDDGGWHSAEVEAEAGQTYAFIHNGTERPDPASRAQDGGVHARSILVDTDALAQRKPWQGRAWETAVIMEIHVGTFTRDGTLRAARDRLHTLASMGITCVELMPLGQFAGDRGWGYDGVLPFALHPAYGTPQDLAEFVRVAHDAGLMVLVDAVYNHFGPEGAVLNDLCPSFFTADRQTPWGAAIDFDRPEVLQFVEQNAEMWLRDYGVDGLRLDAVHQLGAPNDTHVLHHLARHLGKLDLDHPIHLITEDERNITSYVEGEEAIRAQWNDDYHHAIHCLLTGEAQSYYAPFSVDPFGDLVTALRDGQVDQGQDRPKGAEARGEPSGHLSPDHFVNSNQTHDQIGNRAFGERLISLSDPATMRAVHAMLLLAPFVPMLFMGEEIGARAPFQFFTDFDGDLAEAVRKGRRSEFPEFASAEREVPDPNAMATFRASRPYSDPPSDADAWEELTRHCLSLRHDHVVPRLRSGWQDTTVDRLSDRTLWARWRFGDGALEIAFTMEGPPPSLSRDAREIFYIAEDTGAGLRVGIGESK
ncbi:Malto-oligosyltrehalose trehalohydrolase [Rhodobacteraceae bacterium THAF1]|uniref:malto-oligosyltrehalose trehalohydrolase n=1 Tax=Palleronia sp. THAF1 TaxID=2587842 RepID=UPI000F3F434E|nr:malto-oligosyltrehalose trehalohydrolase [Palleronia sp. THAF1]QFU09440.1 Malto-oligosyltrehalose trehalohydrolase [Palleronia sp. THAF1]VDC21905.1 Malto-oligosyltrehalose trehalohydrolase [Rhodobacteraceae bacterium THAF1]